MVDPKPSDLFGKVRKFGSGGEILPVSDLANLRATVHSQYPKKIVRRLVAFTDFTQL